jgi:uncharacterized membrane protein
MIPHWQWLAKRLTSQLWFRAVLLAALGIGTALTALVFRDLIPADFPAKVGADSVDGILNILASSMLAVTTFSLTVMVAAFGRAAENATPRATQLLVTDHTTQNVLSTFIGAFLFSLVGLVALNAGIYGGSGRVVLFTATIIVIVVILVTLVRWIDHLTHFGQLDDVTERVEGATREALGRYAKRPCLGGRALDAAALSGALNAVWPTETGHVLYVDTEQLAKICEEIDCDLYLVAVPGAFVHYRAPLVRFAGDLEDRHIERIRSAVAIGRQRSYEQDPLYGLSVLSEVASRALSPGINDPGTAIDVISRSVRLLLDFLVVRSQGGEEAAYPRLWVAPLSLNEAFDVLYNPIARDGAGIIEVQLRLQEAFKALAESGDPEFVANAARHSALAVERAERAGLAEHELAALRRSALATLN